jgi:hypothetical protein
MKDLLEKALTGLAARLQEQTAAGKSVCVSQSQSEVQFFFSHPSVFFFWQPHGKLPQTSI